MCVKIPTRISQRPGQDVHHPPAAADHRRHLGHKAVAGGVEIQLRRRVPGPPRQQPQKRLRSARRVGGAAMSPSPNRPASVSAAVCQNGGPRRTSLIGPLRPARAVAPLAFLARARVDSSAVSASPNKTAPVSATDPNKRCMAKITIMNAAAHGASDSTSNPAPRDELADVPQIVSGFVNRLSGRRRGAAQNRVERGASLRARRAPRPATTRRAARPRPHGQKQRRRDGRQRDQGLDAAASTRS